MLIHSPRELAFFVISQRKKLKLSQAKVGKLVGLKQQTISEFEIRPEGTQLDTLFRILSALNLDIKMLSKHEPSNNETQWTEEW
ncbi:TPA: helix-turn-helix domain-containing protein [Legionella feeleii]|uniref:Antitoxin HipB n=1 Tax=Legionella feeleii TaxID=453 RepID=A0A0W0U4G4_9GAMM|nr:helix-turn-helix domain-containing protein [Legionella feeleii]KTD02614.1 Antitoxin HipB [Legionella feeleii]SPX62111.1 DNA-binding transcriptional regulator [Legionella feeleii]STX37754.1 DNA-binding transcriptional regulator [Legionella feeleii]